MANSVTTVRAKFKCTEANLLDSPPHAEGQVSVRLEAVIDGSEENIVS